MNTHSILFSCACLVQRWWSNVGLTLQVARRASRRIPVTMSRLGNGSIDMSGCPPSLSQSAGSFNGMEFECTVQFEQRDFCQPCDGLIHRLIAVSPSVMYWVLVPTSQ